MKVKSNEASCFQNLVNLGHLFHLKNTCKNKYQVGFFLIPRKKPLDISFYKKTHSMFQKCQFFISYIL